MTEHNEQNEETTKAQGRFGGLQDAFDEAKPDEFDDITDGIYHLRIEETKCKVSNAGRDNFNWKLRIIGPKHVNRLVWKDNLIEAEHIKWLKKDLACALGVSGENLKVDLDHDLEDGTVSGQLGGRVVEGRIQTKPGRDFPNVYFNRLIDDGSGAVSQVDGEGGGVESPSGDDFDQEGIPF